MNKRPTLLLSTMGWSCPELKGLFVSMLCIIGNRLCCRGGREEGRRKKPPPEAEKKEETALLAGKKEGRRKKPPPEAAKKEEDLEETYSISSRAPPLLECISWQFIK